MKTIMFILGMAFALATPAIETGCAQAPSQRVVAVTTLKIAGLSAKASMDAATQMLKQGQIPLSEWQAIARYYDGVWQPAFNVAVVAAQSDLSSIASPDLVKLLDELTKLVGQITTGRTAL